MSEIEHLSLDGRSLRVFLTVLEEGSVTAAAERLGITQSAVSHTIDKLRQITGEPLFVKAGRGIVPTAHAKALREQAQGVLDAMKAMARGPAFDPASSDREFVIASNDYERDLLLPATFRSFAQHGHGLRLKILAAGLPTAELLRDDVCDLVICVEPPQGNDIVQQQLFVDQLVCYYDPRVRQAPQTLDDYLAARHVTVQFEPGERANFERRFQAIGIHRKVAVVVDNLAGITPFLRDTDLLATVPRLLQGGRLHEFAWCTPPFETPELPLHLVWHRRHDDDTAHRWLREQLLASAKLITPPA